MSLVTVTNSIKKFSPLLVGIVVAFSGFCSLVYQVVWDRTLKYNFGGDSISSAIVAGTFLLGLGVGALWFGKWRKRPFTTYALVEMSIGAYAIISFYVLAPSAIILSRLFSYSISDTDGLRYIVVVACVLFLLPPCILMGGTLPLMFNCFIRPSAYQNKTVGMIYGLNTAGASIGIMAVPFLFLNRISMPSTLLIVGSGNIFLGMALWIYGRWFSGPVQEVEAKETSPARQETDNQLTLLPLLILGFISGFITLSFEISLFRSIGLITKTSPYTFPLVLMPFLLALALGSILFTRFKTYSTTQALKRIGSLFIAAMLGMLAGLPIRYFFEFDAFSVHDLLLEGRLLFPFLLLIVPLPFLSGGVFPLLLRLASSKGKDLPGRTGMIYLANSVGSFLGAMLAQFLGFPYLGAKNLIIALFLAGIITGALCLTWAVSKSKKATVTVRSFLPKYAISLATLPLVFAPLLIQTPMWDVFAFKYTGPNVDRVEGISGVATLKWNSNRSNARVDVNGQYMSALPDHPKHARLVSVALSMPKRESVLVLGLGGGSMIRELVRDPAVKRIDVIDWSHELPQVLESPTAKEMLESALYNPKVRIFSADARVAVSLYDQSSFDVVIDNLAIVGWAGSTSVKSVTYFREIKRILKPTGSFVITPNYEHSPFPTREAVLAGLMENFKYVREYETEGLVVASSQSLKIDRSRAQEVSENRWEILELSQPYADWIFDGFKPITVETLHNTPPILDELLIYEYTLFSGSSGPDKPLPQSQQVIALDPAIYDQYVGRYEISPKFSITISREGNRLMAQTTNQKKTEIFPELKTKFFLKTLDARIEFVKNQSGRVTGLVLYYDDQELSGQKLE